MKNIKLIFGTLLVTVALFYSVAFTACNKPKSSCYSAALENEYKNKFCTADCPGIIGCDGKTYCNACDAAKHGIPIKGY